MSVDAIKPDTEPGLEKWLLLNAEYARIWPNITAKKEPPPDAKNWEGKPDKLQYFAPNPGMWTAPALIGRGTGDRAADPTGRSSGRDHGSVQ